MKKIKQLLLAAFVAATASAEAQSGVFSLNGQQTWPTEGNYYASVSEYINFLYSGTLPAGIRKWNGYWKNGEHLTHDRAYFESHAPSMQAVAVAQLNKQLDAINKAENGKLFGSNATVADNKSYLQNHIKIMDLEYELTEGDSIWMLGIYGDFTRGAYVSHGDGSGLYYCLITNEGHVYILARVSCFNNVDLEETFWFKKGIAKIYKQEDDNDQDGSGRKVTINGEKIASITKSDGDVNIQLNINNRSSVGNITLTGGNATSEIGDVNPGYTGIDTRLVTTTPTTPVVAPYTGLQPYMPVCNPGWNNGCNNPGWNNGAGRSTTIVFSPTVSWGGNSGGYVNRPPTPTRDVPPPTDNGRFVPNPAVYGHGGGTNTGGFQGNPARR